ncbi:hypothetical protein BKA56DRAFT_594661 [Ilyonectria sp. MPI-CAGE-AT-0026]|nr:hypothetical protein BKA56DRAFT_594661 [Ilyonectria sp. MPI-CAGE-AT-0026]
MQRPGKGWGSRRWQKGTASQRPSCGPIVYSSRHLVMPSIQLQHPTVFCPTVPCPNVPCLAILCPSVLCPKETAFENNIVNIDVKQMISPD